MVKVADDPAANVPLRVPQGPLIAQLSLTGTVIRTVPLRQRLYAYGGSKATTVNPDITTTNQNHVG